jgi:hypothetical protein
MTIDVQSAQPAQPVPLAATALSALDTREFYRHVGDINTAFNEATAAYEAAQENLLVLLTEQVSRHVLNLYPSASLVFVRAAAEYHEDAEGVRVASCEGHNHRLVPFEVYDEDGLLLGGFDSLSPVTYLMERLSPLLGVEDQVLDLDNRDWALDCTND